MRLGLAAAVGAMLLAMTSACAPSPPTPTPTPTPTPVPTPTPDRVGTAEQWDLVNSRLRDIYNLSPVSSTEELQSAAFIVGQLWFNIAGQVAQILEEENLPPTLTSPFCGLLNDYYSAGVALSQVTTPQAFLEAEQTVLQKVYALVDAADRLAQAQKGGDPFEPQVHATEEECMAASQEG